LTIIVSELIIEDVLVDIDIKSLVSNKYTSSIDSLVTYTAEIEDNLPIGYDKHGIGGLKIVVDDEISTIDDESEISFWYFLFFDIHVSISNINIFFWVSGQCCSNKSWSKSTFTGSKFAVFACKCVDDIIDS